MRTRLTVDHELVQPQRHRVRFLLHVEATATRTLPRLPLDLALVLDRSGSMGHGKLEAAKDAAAFLVSRLRPDDRIAVVAYDDEVRIVSPSVDGGQRDELIAAIRRIETGGMTNLAGGWGCGRDLIAGEVNGGTLSRVLLLTDGLANVGVTRRDDLVAMCAEAHARGVSTTTIGFGDDFDERLLAAMADAGGGDTYYIEETGQVAAVFGHEIEGLLEVGARGVRVRLRPGGPSRVTRVFHQWPRTGTPAELCFELGDLHARDPKMLLVEMEVHATGTTVEIARLIVSAEVVVEEGRTEYREFTLPVLADLGEPPRVDETIHREIRHFDAARARKEAIERRGRGDFEGAAAVLRDVVSSLAADAHRDPALREEMEDLAGMERRFRRHAVNAKELKYMHQRVRDQDRARRRKLDLIRRDWEKDEERE